jgi:hypothetical protein
LVVLIEKTWAFALGVLHKYGPISFLAAIAALYMTMLVGRSVGQSVGWLVGRCATSFKVSLNVLKWGLTLKKGYVRYIMV